MAWVSLYSTTAKKNCKNGLSKMQNQELIHMQQSKIFTFLKK